MTHPTPSNPISDILTRLEQDSSCRSGCMAPLDDDWKERMRALNPNSGKEREEPSKPGDE